MGLNTTMYTPLKIALSLRWDAIAALPGLGSGNVQTTMDQPGAQLMGNPEARRFRRQIQGFNAADDRLRCRSCSGLRRDRHIRSSPAT
jgi:hypothetical protein